MQNNPRFLELLVENQWLNAQQLIEIRQKHRNDAFGILMELAQQAPSRKQELARLWGDGLGVALVELGKTVFQLHLVQKFNLEFARRRKMIPLYKLGDRVTVACVNIQDQQGLMEAAQLLESPVSPVFAWPEDIEAAIEIHYQSEDAINAMVQQMANLPFFKGGSDTITEESLKAGAGDKAVVEFSKGLLLLAARDRASDIHIEPFESDVRIRFRIDGVLQERLKLSLNVLMPLVSRLKVMASLDIMEKRKPQDGRIALPLPGRSLDFRMSTVPTLYGEKVVLRILGQLKSSGVPELKQMGFSKRNRELLEQLLKHPNGVLLVTGPTGSGKSTTLYSMLRHLNEPGINIMTIEDPVEYRLAGLNQIQVNPAVNLSFETALRAFLRQDPDVILVGEIRDKETARIALQAALTGHLVLSTLHTNNAIQAITRLIDIGVEPFLVGPAILGSMAQRLVRRVCPACETSYTPDESTLREIFEFDELPPITLKRGRGCPECAYSGYKGRLAIHEIFVLTDSIRSLISEGKSAQDIMSAARQEGFQSMRHDGLKKVLRGLTTLEEVNRVAVEP